MRYLGLDLGTKTLGVAISDKLGVIATSLEIIHFNEEDYSDALLKLKKIIEEKKIDKIVLGLPKNMNNSLGESANRSLDFKKLLEETFSLEVIMQDERMSTIEANNVMIKGDLSRKKRKQYIDSLAANIILQRFLDSRKG